MSWVRVAKHGDIVPGSAFTVRVADDSVLVGLSSEGELFAFLDRCTHDGGHFVNAAMVGNQVECPRHGARFDVTTGAAVRMPAVAPLEPRLVRVSDEGWIEVAEEED